MDVRGNADNEKGQETPEDENSASDHESRKEDSTSDST